MTAAIRSGKEVKSDPLKKLPGHYPRLVNEVVTKFKILECFVRPARIWLRAKNITLRENATARIAITAAEQARLRSAVKPFAIRGGRHVVMVLCVREQLQAPDRPAGYLGNANDWQAELAQTMVEHWRHSAASNTIRRQAGSCASPAAISAAVDGTFALGHSAVPGHDANLSSAIEISKPAKSLPSSVSSSNNRADPIGWAEPPTITRSAKFSLGKLGGICARDRPATS